MHARRREGAVEGEEQALRTTSGKIGWKKREAREGTGKEQKRGGKRSSQSILKEISPGCSLEGMVVKLKLQ